MTDGQSEACLWNDPDFDPDLPFGREAERLRLEMLKEEEGKPSWIMELQQKRKLERENDCKNENDDRH